MTQQKSKLRRMASTASTMAQKKKVTVKVKHVTRDALVRAQVVVDPVVTDAAQTVDKNVTWHSTSLESPVSDELQLGTTSATAYQSRNRLATSTVDAGHTTDTVTGPIKFVGTGKNKHQQQIKTKTRTNKKKQVIHKGIHKIPVKTKNHIKKVPVVGEASTVERVFFNLVNMSWSVGLDQFSGLSVDKAILQPNHVFSINHHQAQARNQHSRVMAAPANGVYYCSYVGVADSYLGTGNPVKRFSMPANSIGDDTESFTNLVSETLGVLPVVEVSSYALRNGLRKLARSSCIWKRDFYNGLFILNDEPYNMRYSFEDPSQVEDDITLSPQGFILYMRRVYSATAVNSKLPAYSDAVWFSLQNVDPDPMKRCDWGSGSYIWCRTSVIPTGGGTPVTTVKAYPVGTLPSGGEG